jgi:hypothetical protein
MICTMYTVAATGQKVWYKRVNFPLSTLWKHTEGAEVQLRSCLKSALDGDDGLTSLPGKSNTREEPRYPQNRGWVDPQPGWKFRRAENFFVLAETRTMDYTVRKIDTKKSKRMTYLCVCVCVCVCIYIYIMLCKFLDPIKNIFNALGLQIILQ